MRTVLSCNFSRTKVGLQEQQPINENKLKNTASGMVMRMRKPKLSAEMKIIDTLHI
jgi:hypothetical protein